MREFPMELELINLSDIYTTRDEHRQLARRTMRRLGNLKVATFLICVDIGMLIHIAYENRIRIERLEAARKKEDEMAG